MQDRWIQIAPNSCWTSLAVRRFGRGHTLLKAQVPCATRCCCTVAWINELGTGKGGTLGLLLTERAVDLHRTALISAIPTPIGIDEPSANSTSCTGTSCRGQLARICFCGSAGGLGGSCCGEGGGGSGASHLLQESGLREHLKDKDAGKPFTPHRPSSAQHGLVASYPEAHSSLHMNTLRQVEDLFMPGRSMGLRGQWVRTAREQCIYFSWVMSY